MDEEILLKEYQNLCPGVKKIYVVPLINFQFKETNYLYLLYKKFIEGEVNGIQIESISFFAHPEIVLSKIKNEKSVLHYHWLEISDLQSLLGMIWKLCWISLYKLIGGKIIWTIHNEIPHSNNFVFLNRFISKYMSRLADKLQVHCKSAIDIMMPVLNVQRNKFFIINHPEFPVKFLGKEKAVKLLNDKISSGDIKKEDTLFLMFGEITEYKGIKEVVEIFNNLDKKNKLIIAGVIKKGNQNYFKRILLSIKNKEQVLIYNKRISDGDVPVFFNACDAAVFNFSDILTSGSVAIALNYNKKVIIPMKGCLKELTGPNIIQFNNLEELKNILYTLK
ncbi:MAG: glycosyltransferase [Ignavibacteriaceae bacterium]